MIKRVTLAACYMGVLVAYVRLRGEAFEVPGPAAEIAVLVVPSFVLGLGVGRWWVLIVPVAFGIIYVGIELGIESSDRLDLAAYLLYVTLPFMLVGTAVGVATVRSIKWLRHRESS